MQEVRTGGSWVTESWLCWCQGVERETTDSVCRCECNLREECSRWRTFSPTIKTTFSCVTKAWSEDKNEEDKCENARRHPGRECVLIKNSARENRRRRSFWWPVSAPRIKCNTNGLQTSLNGVKRSGIHSKKKKDESKAFSKRPGAKGRRERGQRKRPAACCWYLQIQNFVAELGEKNASRFIWRWLFKCTAVCISSELTNS